MGYLFWDMLKGFRIMNANTNSVVDVIPPKRFGTTDIKGLSQLTGTNYVIICNGVNFAIYDSGNNWNPITTTLSGTFSA